LPYATVIHTLIIIRGSGNISFNQNCKLIMTQT